MCKRIVSLFLAVLLLLPILPAYAEEQGEPLSRRVTIVNIKTLEKLAENCRLDSYSQNLTVSLEADLDLTDRNFEGIPIFCGTFEGNGHMIRGLDMTREGSAQGFFRYLTETAVVQNLHLEGSVQPGGSAGEVGSIAGSNGGTIRNCGFSGTVSGKELVGGIVGTNLVTGVIDNVRISGRVSGEHFVGGIAGKNAGVIRYCENEAKINETPQENTVALEDITLRSAVSTEAVNTATDIGGIAGTSTGMIRGCVNHASIGHPSMGYNVGGIAGTQSGTILECENRGEIFGRKEVGGIAGQMEPSTVMKFEEDTLQILQRQLTGMGKIVDDASSNVQDAGESIVGQIGQMQYYVFDAMEAVETLIPEDIRDPQKPDDDTIQAARNSIGSSLMGMSRTMEGVAATAYSSLGAVSTNLHAMYNQISAMQTTISNAAETLGGSIVDRSDEDTEEDLSGKVADCVNLGDVHADLNGGGITGAISMENDLDVEEDWLVSGKNSLNFESEIRAVVYNCENDAPVTVGKQNAGGIVGLQSVGLVKYSRNFGRIEADGADYAGGISGRSNGFIRSSHANGEITAGRYVGGIAGSAAIVTDCYSLVQLQNGKECLGAILGEQGESTTEEEDPIARNFYLPFRTDPGGIDGISYDGLAQPMDEARFFLLEDLPQRFRQVVVTFRYGNGNERSFTVEAGSSFPAEWIPPIPPKEGRQAFWRDLSEETLSGIFFDVVFEQDYTAQTTVLSSGVCRGELPVLFVQGVFDENASLEAAAYAETVPLESGLDLLESWQFATTQTETQMQIRVHLPEDADPDEVVLLLHGADGSWRQAEYHVFGSYAVASLMPGDDVVALAVQSSFPWLLVLAAVAATAVIGLLLRKKRTKA